MSFTLVRLSTVPQSETWGLVAFSQRFRLHTVLTVCFFYYIVDCTILTIFNSYTIRLYYGRDRDTCKYLSHSLWTQRVIESIEQITRSGCSFSSVHLPGFSFGDQLSSVLCERKDWEQRLQDAGLDEDGEMSDMEEFSDKSVPLAHSFEPVPSTSDTMQKSLPGLHGAVRHRAIQKSKRQAKRLLQGGERHTRLISKNIVQSAVVSKLANDRAQAPHSQQAYLGLRSTAEAIQPLEILLRDGYTYIPYDG